MANEDRKTNKKRRKPGVPTLLVILLIIIALVMGGLAGFAIARRTEPNGAKLQEANARITELENTLTLIGFHLGEDNPQSFNYMSAPLGDGTSDLAGQFGQPSGDDVWNDAGLLSGTLQNTGEPVVVAEFEGGQLMSNEVIPEYNDQLTSKIFAGYNADEVADSVLQTVMSSMVSEKIIAKKATELGLDQLSEEDERQIDAEAEKIYNDQLNYYTAFVAQEGMTQEEIKRAAADYMQREVSVTKDSIAASLRETWPTQKFYDYTVKDVAVTDEEVETHYQEVLARQKSTFAEYPEEYEYTHNEGETILYNPEGYRAVRDLLIAFDSAEDSNKASELISRIEELNPDTDAEQIKALEEELNPLYEALEARAQEVMDKLRDGASFMDLMDEYGSDEAMKSDPLRTEGYYLSENSFLFSNEFVEGCLLLEKPGDVSSPLRSFAGIHLAQYVGDVAPGEVALEDVYDAIKAETLENKCDQYYENQKNALLDAANVRYYPERLQ